MDRQINYKTMRMIVGLIAVLLAPAVYFLSNTENLLTSISISYWTDSRDVFVGSLIAVGFFLSAYNGKEGRDWEYYLSKLSCVFAICVALFPTQGFSGHDIPPAWATGIANAVNLETVSIHFGAAGLLFACLIAMIWFFSNRALKKGKTVRAYIYRAISILMITGIVFIFIYGLVYELNNSILLIEIWGLTLFGIGWLIAGTYKTEINNDDLIISNPVK